MFFSFTAQCICPSTLTSLPSLDLSGAAEGTVIGGGLRAQQLASSPNGLRLPACHPKWRSLVSTFFWSFCPWYQINWHVAVASSFESSTYFNKHWAPQSSLFDISTDSHHMSWQQAKSPGHSLFQRTSPFPPYLPSFPAYQGAIILFATAITKGMKNSLVSEHWVKRLSQRLVPCDGRCWVHGFPWFHSHPYWQMSSACF